MRRIAPKATVLLAATTGGFLWGRQMTRFSGLTAATVPLRHDGRVGLPDNGP